jgi:hypothetical protein
LEAEESADRDSLFGGMMEKLRTMSLGKEEEDAKRPAEQVGNLPSGRPDALATLNDKG